EDGIRDATVTGVQTCALPISPKHLRFSFCVRHSDVALLHLRSFFSVCRQLVSRTLSHQLAGKHNKTRTSQPRSKTVLRVSNFSSKAASSQNKKQSRNSAKPLGAGTWLAT